MRKALPSTQRPHTRRLNRAASFSLALAVSLVLFSLAQKIYRLTLPTDGWAFETGEIGSPDQDRPTYTQNLLKLPSPLHPGDRLLGVEDQSFEAIYVQGQTTQPQPLPTWQVGHTVRYTVERAGQAITLAVPLYRWSGQVIARELLTDMNLWAALLLAAVGGFVFLQRPAEWATHPLLLFSVCLLANQVSVTVVDWGLPELLHPPLVRVATFFSNWIFAVVMFPSLLLLTLLFPRPKQFVQQHPRSWVSLLYGLIPLLIVVVGPIATVGWVSVLSMALLSLMALAHAFLTVRDPVGRAQVRWAVGGLAVMVFGFIPLTLSGLGWLPVPFPLWLEEIWFPLMLIIMALGFGVAILRYRLFEIDLILNRALVYGLLTAGVIGLYVLVVGYLGALFRTEANLLISLAATGLVAVLFQPARDRLQRSVNRLMYGQRDEPVAVLSRLGERLAGTPAPEDLLTGLAETVAQTLKLPYVALALKEADQFQVVAVAHRPTAADLTRPEEVGTNTIIFPLVYQTETIGQLLVAPRGPGEQFNPADELLLQNIARQAGAAVYAVRLNQALQQARTRLVTTREEERRRLRRDLHDGLGPIWPAKP